MTVCSSPRKLQWALLAETRHHQATNASERLGWSSAASSTTNYRSLSFTKAGLAITYFDPKTARGSVDCGRCPRVWFRYMGEVCTLVLFILEAKGTGRYTVHACAEIIASCVRSLASHTPCRAEGRGVCTEPRSGQCTKHLSYTGVMVLLLCLLCSCRMILGVRNRMLPRAEKGISMRCFWQLLQCSVTSIKAQYSRRFTLCQPPTDPA